MVWPLAKTSWQSANIEKIDLGVICYLMPDKDYSALFFNFFIAMSVLAQVWGTMIHSDALVSHELHISMCVPPNF